MDRAAAVPLVRTGDIAVNARCPRDTSTKPASMELEYSFLQAYPNATQSVDVLPCSGSAMSNSVRLAIEQQPTEPAVLPSAG